MPRTIECVHKDHSRCKVTEALAAPYAQVVAHVTDEVCWRCSLETPDKGENGVTIWRAIFLLRQHNITPESLLEKTKHLPKIDYAAELEKYPNGPGTRLHKFLAQHGIKPSSTCTCYKLAHKMNTKGTVWILKHIWWIMKDILGEAKVRLLTHSGDKEENSQ